MKEEIRRIMNLVKEGKLSPDDAAELIEAFEESPDEEEEDAVEGEEEAAAEAEADSEFSEETESAEGEPGSKKEDPFSRLIGSIEKIGKDVAKNVNWSDIATQVRTGVGKGINAIKEAADEAGVSKGFGVLFGSQETKRVELPLHVPDGKTLRIEATSGSIAVRGGAELGSVDVTAGFRAYNEEEAKKKADAYSPMIEETEQYIALKLQEGPDSSVEAVINLPEGVPVEIRNTSGEVTVTDTKSGCRINGTSSQVKLSGMDGTIEVHVASGDVKISDSKSSILTVETKSGDISITDVAAAINIRTSSGDISLTGISGRTLSAEAASGDIKADIEHPVSGNVNMRTVSGDVTLEIMDGSDCRVSLSTLQGTVSTTLELEDRNEQSLKITGRLGDGSGAIDLSAVNGDVSLGWRNSETE